MLLSWEVYFYYIDGWSIIIYIVHPFDFAWAPHTSEQGKTVLGFSTSGCTRTDRWAVLGWCCLVLRPGPQTADWCKTETRGWSGWREGKERERVEAEARVTVRDGREGWGGGRRHYWAGVSQQVDGASGCGSGTSLLPRGSPEVFFISRFIWWMFPTFKGQSEFRDIK